MGRKKKKPFKHNYLHLTYLLYLPIIFALAMYIWSLSVSTAQEQIRNLALREKIRNENLANARQGNITYRVQPDDTLQSISKNFEISPDTIRWANNLQSDELMVDSIIIIPPITGVTHIVKYGDTIQGIAKKYQVEPEAILNYEFNRFSDDKAFPLIVGEMLYIPYGKK
ncbi:MAG TPA: LysM peptidoglycan-binding domain-containing protein [Candidatus Woesebacteria bacterium]|nr:LysM peptidoglycan-binding domain-containing protein [Candidatus Woesebacteria bacterium]